VQAYPGASEKVTVSTDGGFEPVWSPDGRELFYRIGTRMMVVSIQTTPALRSSRPRQLFEGPYISGLTIAAIARTYDVAPDGQHFLMIETPTVTSNPIRGTPAPPTRRAPGR